MEGAFVLIVLLAWSCHVGISSGRSLGEAVDNNCQDLIMHKTYWKGHMAARLSIKLVEAVKTYSMSVELDNPVNTFVFWQADITPSTGTSFTVTPKAWFQGKAAGQYLYLGFHMSYDGPSTPKFISILINGQNVCGRKTLSANCGIENSKASGKRIIGGSGTAPNQYPWMVRLPMGCGGSLITDRHILTAKHCVNEGTDYWRGQMVKVSVHNQNDATDYQEIPIKEVKWPKGDDHDLAMITLDRAVDLTDNTIGTVCLPNGANEDYKGEKALAMGWGMAKVCKYSSCQHLTLKQVLLTVSSTEKRNYLYTKVEFYAGTYHEPCSGDSGGPLVHKDDVTGRWTIIGTLWGGGFNCRTGKVSKKEPEGKWNKVTDHLDWIKYIIMNF